MAANATPRHNPNERPPRTGEAAGGDARADNRPRERSGKPPNLTFNELPGAHHFSRADLHSWPAAERRYRELVQRCHPDRQDEPASDAAQFIEITTAFKQLRRQYRATGRLPVHSVGRSVDQRTSRAAARPAANQAAHAPEPGRRASASTSSVERDPHRRGTRPHGGWQRTWRRSRVAIAAVLAIGALLALVAVLDHSLQRSMKARGEAYLTAPFDG